MSITRTPCIVLHVTLALVLGASAVGAQGAHEQEVIAVVERMFQGLRSADSGTVRA